MGLLQAAYRTYENLVKIPDKDAGGHEPLTPIAHIINDAQIEITIHLDGTFVNARVVPKDERKTVLPATKDSAIRTGNNSRAHPLCDQLRYLASYGGQKHVTYLTQLQKWAQSEHSHPTVHAVLRYIQVGSILTDLQSEGIIILDCDGMPTTGKINNSEYSKCLVRWLVVTLEDGFSRCWKDPSLQEAYILFESEQQARATRDFCMISGEMDTPTYNHPDGVLSYPSKAKLICSNENAYRGRFTSESQASSVGSIASAKVHSALRWLRANHGVVIGGRTFLWWSPQGKKLPSFDFLEPTDTESEEVFPNYQRQLRQTLDGYCQKLKPEDGAVIAAFDAATRGRLSVTYYSEMRALDLVDRLQNWYDTCRLDTRYRQAWSPTLKSIVKFAFGTQRVGKVVVDSKAYGEHFQHLFHCLVDAQPLPSDIVRALVLKANHLEIYSTYNKKTKSDNREQLLSTACAVVRKYHNDKLKKEVWTLALDEQNLDRSYLFGRLLAVAEHVERSTYEKGEGREPNAIRLQTVFSQRPIYAWRILEEALKPYYQHLEPKDRKRFRKVTEKIAQPLNPDDPDLNKKLDDVYLLGYYHQRAALTCKKDAQNNNTSEEYEHESAEE